MVLKIKNLLLGSQVERVDSALSIMLFSYLVLYFFVPYKPWTSPISLHTPILLIGLAFVVFRVLLQTTSFNEMFLSDFIVFLFMVGFFLVSSLLIHLDKFSMSGFQAYAISFLCFIFVSFTVRNLDLDRFHSWMNIYIIASAVIILLQVNFAGNFYVAGFLGKSGFGPTSQGWGFADASTLAGGIIVWFLTVQFTRYSFSEITAMSLFSEKMNLCALGFGTVGLFYTLSRAAWLGFAFSVLCVFVMLYVLGNSKTKAIRALLCGLLFLTVFAVLLSPRVYHKADKLMSFVKFTTSPKNMMAHDIAVGTRVQAWRVASDSIKSTPVWGIGIDQFPLLYHQMYPMSEKSANGLIDIHQYLTPHNSYLYYAVEIGMLPAFFLILLLVKIVIQGIKVGCYSNSYPFLMGMIAICIWAGTNDYIKERIFWIVLGMTFGLTRLYARIAPITATTRTPD